jgi:hypothetical protein
VEDFDGLYFEVNKFLNGRGVPNIESAIHQVLVKPVHIAMKKNFNIQMMSDFFSLITLQENKDLYKQNHKYFLNSIKNYMETKNSISSADVEFNKTLENYLLINTDKFKQTAKFKILLDKLIETDENKLVFYSWMLLHGIGKMFTKGNWEKRSRSLIDEMFLNKLVDDLVTESSIETKSNLNDIISILTEYQYWFEKTKNSDDSMKNLMKKFLADFHVRSFINVNRYQEVLWFKKESLETLIDWLEIMGCLNIIKENYPSLTNIESDFEELDAIILTVKEALENSEFKLEMFLNNLDK